MLVVIGVEALFADPNLEHAVALDPRLAAEPRVHANVESFVEDVLFALFGFAQELTAFFDIDVTSRASTHTAARRSLGGVCFGGRLENRRSNRNFDFDGLIEKPDNRHHSTP